MDEVFLKPYSPKDTEDRIYTLWEQSGFFNPETAIEKGKTSAEAEPFTIVMPPPNVTGVLHMGHALTLTLQDIMIRYMRMRGRRTLWIPGTDHAAIATQAKVEKEIIKSEGKNRHDLGREELLRRIELFAKESHDTIVKQIRSLGASCDWSREAFTLDPLRSLAVRTMFKKMYDDGLIYRGLRIVNWDPKGQTTISDDEIVYEEREATLYTLRYSKDFPIPIATTRPETKVGDTAVAVHPNDARYKEHVGKLFKVVFCGVPIHIKVVADESVDPTFGTGAVGVTPAHSFSDWEIKERHKLPSIQVVNEYGKMAIGDERILGKKTSEARITIVEWLKSEGLIEKEEKVKQNIATAERTGGIIEPLPKLQWFIAVNKEFRLLKSTIPGIKSGSMTTLKEIMRKAVEGGSVEIIPSHFSKTYFHWIENLRDWCISRQIWYGHRIPVWYKADQEDTSRIDENAKAYVGIEAPEEPGWIQDPDTLDTWFSSGLWTFSTLGWPYDTEDLHIYHPTSVLETGYEILFFWVARMILMSGYALGDIPFETVYLNGTVRDAKGRKMSKSLGNGIDPLDIKEKFGTDAARLALVIGGAPGTDSKISEEKIRGYKNFANKIWNVARFVLENTKDFDSEASVSSPLLNERLATLNTVLSDSTEDMEVFRFHLASEKIYHYFWHTFADTIIEESKKELSGDAKERLAAQKSLVTILTLSLKALHPFMPFVTEEIWQHLPRAFKDAELLMVSAWPL